jgi:hypothetical protein
MREDLRVSLGHIDCTTIKRRETLPLRPGIRRKIEDQHSTLNKHTQQTQAAHTAHAHHTHKHTLGIKVGEPITAVSFAEATNWPTNPPLVMLVTWVAYAPVKTQKPHVLHIKRKIN